MAYNEIGEVKIVILGGTNDRTGEPNPTSVEGYFLRTESKPNKFDKAKPKNFYVFSTRDGEVGIYGSGGLDQLMKNAVIGVMTKVTDTGERLDTGKGNPMKVYRVQQDPDRVAHNQKALLTSPDDESGDDGLYEDLAGNPIRDLSKLEHLTPIRTTKSAAFTSTPTASAAQQKLQSLLKSRN
jgi:hypothetical protein